MFEKVNPQHPDKVADRIAGAIVDLCYTKSEWPKVAAEVLLGHGLCSLQIETSERLTAEELEAIVHRIAGEEVEVRALIVPQDVHLADNQAGAVRCGDNGIFRGCAPTHEQKLLTALAQCIYDHLPYDGKYIVNTVHGTATENVYFTFCQSHMDEETEMIFTRQYLDPICEAHRKFMKAKYGDITNYHYLFNPLGPWTGGTDVDCGATNRKLGSDLGDGVTGGGLCGKDLSKADVSVNIVCYLLAVEHGQTVTACCSIGDEQVTFHYADGKEETLPFADIVERARLYIHCLGGFEKFSEWGLIRHKDA